METDLVRSRALNNIPKRKLQDALENINNSSDDIKIKHIKSIAINRYAESNIPIEYWNLSFEKDFKGNNILLKKYQEYTTDLKLSYLNGHNICFAGTLGTGKTMSATAILKKACQKGFTCLYTDISHVVSVLTQASNEEKYFAKRELCMVDFLVIDEMDPRFFDASTASQELFAKNIEIIFRTRRQNKLPTLICTNSPNLLESFEGPLKQSLSSLFSDKMEMVYVFGQDFRKENI